MVPCISFLFQNYKFEEGRLKSSLVGSRRAVKLPDNYTNIVYRYYNLFVNNQNNNKGIKLLSFNYPVWGSGSSVIPSHYNSFINLNIVCRYYNLYRHSDLQVAQHATKRRFSFNGQKNHVKGTKERYYLGQKNRPYLRKSLYIY